jgi:hypothetical protein
MASADIIQKTVSARKGLVTQPINVAYEGSPITGVAESCYTL